MAKVKFKFLLRPVGHFTEQSKTPWFESSVKPARPGWYEVRDKPGAFPYNSRSMKRINGNSRFFNGEKWVAGWMGEFTSIFGCWPNCHQWRGLRAPYRKSRSKA